MAVGLSPAGRAGLGRQGRGEMRGGEGLGWVGGERKARWREAATVFLDRYRMSMLEFARMPVLEMARYQVHRLRSVTTVEGILHTAERATPMHTLLSLTESSESASQRVSKSAGRRVS